MDEATERTARELISRTRARTTPARVQILAALLNAQRPLSHQDMQAALPPQTDRVTVYRVLDWLTEVGLAHKLSGDDRVWRFSVSPSPHQHAHFHCQKCGRFYCLEHVGTDLSISLPASFLTQSIEITVKGICSDCR